MDSSAMQNKNRDNSDMENSHIKSNANYQNGLKVRTDVMGEAHVKRSLDSTTGLSNTLGAAHGKMTQYCRANIAH